jgi:pimeloyl-ACP methyl ester carboxylesterase
MEHPISYRTIQIDGISIFYREAGPKDAPTILLLHGLPSSSRMFQPLLTRLADDYHVVAPDYPLLRECLRLAPQVALQW